MNFPLETAQRLLRDLRRPSCDDYKTPHAYQIAVDDLINIIYRMDHEISSLNARLMVLEPLPELKPDPNIRVPEYETLTEGYLPPERK